MNSAPAGQRSLCSKLQTKQQTGSPLVWLGLLLYFLRNESCAIIRPEAGTGWLAGTPHNSGESEGNEFP